MSLKGKELIIEGETYVDGRAVYELLDGVISDNAIRELGKTWGRQKVGNRYYYRKADVKLPVYPLARWQRLALMYMSLIRPDFPVMQFAENYYQAKSFLNAAQVEMLTTGTLTCSHGQAVFVLLLMGDRLHMAVANDTDFGARQLTKSEIKDGERTYETNGGALIASWDIDLLTRIADELLDSDGGEQ